MKLYNGFLKFLKDQGIDKEDIIMQHQDNYWIISMNEQGEENIDYNVLMILYDDDSLTEIYIRKEIDTSDILSILKETNRLTLNYLGVSFCLTDKYVSTKMVCQPKGNIEEVLKSLIINMDIAKKEFINFK